MKRLLTIITFLTASLLISLSCDNSSNNYTKEELVQQILSESASAVSKANQEAFSSKRAAVVDSGTIIVNEVSTGSSMTGSLNYNIYDDNTMNATGTLTISYSNLQLRSDTLSGSLTEDIVQDTNMATNVTTLSYTINGDINITGTNAGTLSFNSLQITITMTNGSYQFSTPTGSVTLNSEEISLDGL